MRPRFLSLPLIFAIAAMFVQCAPSMQPRLGVLSTEALRQAQHGGGASAPNQHHDLRFVYWGPKGRIRGRAEVWLQEPDKWRYTVYGGHGGVVFVLVCDGAQIMGLDLAGSRYVQGTASAAHIDRWLPDMALHLEAADWVGLWQGRYPIPKGASFLAETAKAKPQALWQHDPQTRMRAELDEKTGQVRTVRALDKQNRVLRRIDFTDFDRDHMPNQIEICMLDADGQKHQVQMHVTKRQTPETLPQTTFLLTAPPGITTELLP